MKHSVHTLLLGLGLLSTLDLRLPTAFAQSTAFTYQGRLTDNGAPANGRYDLRAALFDSPSDGNVLGATNVLPNVAVSNGLFTVQFDFGDAAFVGGGVRWLELAVRTNGSVGSYSTLAPRQPLTPAPMALWAGLAGTAYGVAPNAITTAALQDAGITGAKIAGGQVVRSLNGLTDAVALAGGANITLTPAGNSLLIAGTGLSGAGTANAVPLFTGPALLGDSAIYQSGGRVGIGTAGPTATLEVNGTAKAEDLITRRPWADVRAFGAVGDDDVDDTDAIQAAIDSLGDTNAMRGGSVFLPPGRYLISRTLILDRKCGQFYGLGPGGAAGTSGSVLKWKGPAGSPMVRITRCWFTRLHGLRFVGNSGAQPSAAIEMAASTNHSPVNTQLSLSWIWVGHFSGFDPDGNPGFLDGIVTSGANLQDDQGQMDHVFVQGVAGSCVRLANTQNVLWQLSNVVLNGEGAEAVGITCGTRHVILVNPYFGSNGKTDIEIIQDGMLDVYNMGSEGSGRLALATGGAQLRVRGGYWQAGGTAHPDGNVINISGGASTVRMEDFHFTQSGGPPVKCKMRGPSAVAIFSNVALPSAPGSFFDLTNTAAGDRRRIEFLGGSTLANFGSFVHEWSHPEPQPDFNVRANDFVGRTRLRQAAGQSSILGVWNSGLTSRLFAVDTAGITLGVDTSFSGLLEGSEMADPGPAPPNKGRLYFRDNGAGKTQLVVRFGSGAIQVLATEP